MKRRLTMAEGFSGDYSPLRADKLVLIEWFSAVQLIGKRRKTDPHACYASFGPTHELYGNRSRYFRKVNPETCDDYRNLANYIPFTFGYIS